MAVSIFEHEADLISKHIGRRYVKQSMFKSIDDLMTRHQRWLTEYTRVPCPFLKDSKCSIYEVRPIACRLHHTVAEDNSCCDLSTMQVTPAVNLGILEKAHVFIGQGQPVADIREYFPKE